MASIEKLGNKTGNGKFKYRVRWRDPSGQPHSRRVPDLASAKKLQQDVEAEVATGHNWEPEAAGSPIDLREILNAFIREVSRSLRASTAYNYARELDVFQRYLGEKVGKMAPWPPSILTRALLAQFYDWLEIGMHRRPRKVTTKRRFVESVSLMWEWAYQEDEYAELLGRPRRLRMPKVDGSPTIAPTWQEMDGAIAHCKGWQRRLLILLRFTGLRVGQAMKLKWSDLDLKRGTLTIRGELGKSQQERQGRIVPLSPHLIAELAIWERDGEWLVASNRKPGPRHREPRARDARRAWSRAGVRPDAWKQSHHSFRKGFVSGLKRAGADTDAVEFLVGHSLGLRGVYTDPGALPLRAVVNLIPPLTPADQIAHTNDENDQGSI